MESVDYQGLKEGLRENTAIRENKLILHITLLIVEE